MHASPLPPTRLAPAAVPPPAVGYRGGPLPGMPEPAGAAPPAGRWQDSVRRWLAALPRDLPPRA